MAIKFYPTNAVNLIIMTFFLSLSTCAADDGSNENYNHRPYSSSNILPRLKELLEANRPNQDFSNTPEDYYRVNDRISSDPNYYPKESESYVLNPDPESLLPQHREFSLRSMEHHNRQNFKSICRFETIAEFFTLPGYEYRPDFYEHKICRHEYQRRQNYDINKNEYCSSFAGSACIQRNETIFVTRRRKDALDANCWEPEIRSVFSACECMRPEH